MTPQEEARRVAEAVALARGGDANAIMSPHRGTPEVCRMRWLAMYVYWNRHDPLLMTYTRVGVAFGRDRTTVRHGMTKLIDIIGVAGLSSELKVVGAILANVL